MRLLELICLVVPAYCANMAPPFVRFWPGWNRPISRRWLGEHKSVMGFVAGVVVGTLAGGIEAMLPWPGRLFEPAAWIALGFAQGLGAMAGDSAKSFVKRRLRIAPGERWVPFDQLDFIAGALLFSWPWLRLGLGEVALIVALTIVADMAVNRISFRLGIRDTPW